MTVNRRRAGRGGVGRRLSGSPRANRAAPAHGLGAAVSRGARSTRCARCGQHRPAGTVAAFVAGLGENAGGQVVGIEIKSAASVTTGDLRDLKRLASVAGDQFEMGVVPYDGAETLPLGERFWAAPLSILWGQAILD